MAREVVVMVIRNAPPPEQGVASSRINHHPHHHNHRCEPERQHLDLVTYTRRRGSTAAKVRVEDVSREGGQHVAGM